MATPVTVESVFPIGSTSKVLTSLALGQLVERGKLDLDEPIQTYVPSFPRKACPLTARLLAGHLCGLRNYNMAAGEYANQREFGSVGDALAVFKDDSFLFEPGTRYVYSAYNFVLLSAAIEGASGRDFLSYVHERIAAPFGLLRTTPDRRTAPMPGRVTTYVAGWGGTPMPAPTIDVSNKWAAGGFVSAPSDMVRLGNRSFAVDGRELRVAHHGGTANGAMSFFFILPEVDLVVALQVNLLFEPFSSFANTAYAVAGSFLAADGGSSSR